MADRIRSTPLRPYDDPQDPMPVALDWPVYPPPPGAVDRARMRWRRRQRRRVSREARRAR